MQKKTNIFTEQEFRSVQVRMLDEVDIFCRENNLRYYLTAGSLLGAVRHKGFIPWDDDIDIMMPRKDYERFIRTYKADKSSVISILNEPKYYLAYAKVIDNGSVLVEECDADLKIGIYVDVFPLDNVADSYFVAAVKYKMMAVLRYMVVIKNLQVCESRSTLKNAFLRTLKFFTSFITRYRLLQLIVFLSKGKSAELGSTKYVSVISSGIAGAKRETYPSEWFAESVDVPFEGLTVKAPKEYHKNLTTRYGNYMQLPPVEQRVTHHGFEVWKKE